jgi:membrane-associated protease RseP (regulator of RpoE activity)
MRNRIGRAEWFALGEVTFDRPLAVVPDATAGQFSAPGTLGNIGGPILSRCRVTFDYGRRRVGFERGDDFARPFEADMSGLGATRSPAGLAVRAVNPGTPAAEAGLRVGDVVTRLDGRPVAELDGAALRKLLQREGYALRVEYQRGGATRSATLRLRRLL